MINAKMTNKLPIFHISLNCMERRILLASLVKTTHRSIAWPERWDSPRNTHRRREASEPRAPLYLEARVASV